MRYPITNCRDAYGVQIFILNTLYLLTHAHNAYQL